MAYSTSFARAVECAAWFQDGELGRASQAGSTVTCSSSWGAGGGRSPQKQLQQSRMRNLQADRLGLAFSPESLRRSAFSNNKFQPGSCSRKERPGSGCGPVALIGGFSGAFWDGADSESTADEHVAAKKGASCTETSVLLSLIQDIEPLDVSHISKDASPDSMDAMKRTITGILGLMPSDQFQVTIEAFREPLAKLLVSSMMTGYTLRNAEYRLSLQRSLDLSDEEGATVDGLPLPTLSVGTEDPLQGSVTSMELADTVEQMQFTAAGTSGFLEEGVREEELDSLDCLGPVSPEVAKYIQQLQSKLLSTQKDLDDCKHSLTALEMEGMVGEEQNDLLDYLRSLEPDKVAELSQPTSSEVEDVIRLVINSLLETLCVANQPLQMPEFGNGASSSISSPWEEDGVAPELLANIPVHLESTMTATRDYFARLLFWCMLLGHHMRGLEYRLELSRTLSLSGDTELRLEEERYD
ncbi:unnamed protein product [Sphagnum jensenii]|uniref:Uncharacterized protein n=1 Tax=Sphagnum jensenii TaxID=128206 RepID=A0ABP1BCP3_9BRYO